MKNYEKNLQFFKDNGLDIKQEFWDILTKDYEEVVKFVNNLKK